MPQPSALSILREVFGYHAFRGRQEEIVNALAEGQNLLVLMPTGGGKSLCYQIPALMRRGLAVVVSPLIALMDDQVAACRPQAWPPPACTVALAAVRCSRLPTPSRQAT